MQAAEPQVPRTLSDCSRASVICLVGADGICLRFWQPEGSVLRAPQHTPGQRPGFINVSPLRPLSKDVSSKAWCWVIPNLSEKPNSVMYWHRGCKLVALGYSRPSGRRCPTVFLESELVANSRIQIASFSFKTREELVLWHLRPCPASPLALQSVSSHPVCSARLFAAWPPRDRSTAKHNIVQVQTVVTKRCSCLKEKKKKQLTCSIDQESEWLNKSSQQQFWMLEENGIILKENNI